MWSAYFQSRVYTMMSLLIELARRGLFPKKSLAMKGGDTSTVSRKFFTTCFLLSLFSWQLFVNAGPLERDQAKRIHDRLTGVPPTTEMLTAMEAQIEGGEAVLAALLAIDGEPGLVASPNFYNVTLKNWAAPWTNEAGDVFVALNDYIALVIGLIKDDADFRNLLNGTVMYHNPDPGMTNAYATNNNLHYEELEADGANLGEVLVQADQTTLTGLPVEAIAGIFSTRAAGKAFFKDGTNRAMLRFTLKDHLCNDMEALKDIERPAHRIRQDVSRSPGGDSRLFLTGCVGCHSGMDPLAQAFAFYQYTYAEGAPDDGSVTYTPGVVQLKYLFNEGNFKPGYITDSDSWTNHWRQGRNVDIIGWRNPLQTGIYTTGEGARSMGDELANSHAFSYCQVKKAFQAVCLREPTPTDGVEVDRVVGLFETSGHNMKNVFAELAASCALSSVY
jgi:hypothetical protein